MKIEKAIELIVNAKNEEFKQTNFKNKRLVLNKPSSVESYINAGLSMKLNEETFSNEEKNKFKELQIRHINLFNFIELVKNDEKTGDNLIELFQNVVDFCPESKERKRKKVIAYQFLHEKKIQETTSSSYFTRSPYTDSILKNIDIPEHQLVQILLDYQTYINSTEWRNYIIAKQKVEEEEALRRRNMKKTFTQWLRA
jgi:hypothetical protein